jgi:DNA-binding transcriptional regulator YiaG
MVRKVKFKGSDRSSVFRPKFSESLNFGGQAQTMRIVGKHISGARGILRMSIKELAEAASVDENTIATFESETREPRRATVLALLQALEDRGVEFTNGDRPGVHFNPEKVRIPATGHQQR